MFIQVVSGKIAAEAFAEALFPLLSDHTIPAEHDLIKNTPAVIRITHSFNPTQRKALERCVRIMGQGMADYQDTESLAGLKDSSRPESVLLPRCGGGRRNVDRTVL